MTSGGTPAPTATNPLSVHTDHCLCTNLLIATTYVVSALPRRASPSLDKAMILPCPQLSQQARHALQDRDESELESDAALAEEPTHGYTLLCSVTSAAKAPAILVRREDGFEKRYLLRCGRCRLVVGYYLDWSQHSTSGEEHSIGKVGKREDLLYLLPGAMVSTEEMKAGKQPGEDLVGFGLAE